MAQQRAEAVQGTFIKGLITERSELTFPEDASTDELNCDLLKTGARRRRLGLEQESGGVLSTEAFSTANTVFSVNRWMNVAEQEGIEFVVVQMGSSLWFYQQGTTALSGNRVDTTLTSGVEYSIDLSAYQRPDAVSAGSVPVQCTSIKGALVVASPELNTFYVTRNTTTGAFTVSEISFRVRDFDWQGDITTYDDISPMGSFFPGIGRIYDTKNAGWSDGANNIGDNALSTYRSAKSNRYPPLTHPWYSGKNSSGNFSVSEWEKIYTGSTLIVNGHYVVDLYSRNRNAVSDIAGTELNTTEDARFSTVAGYAGRVFYAGMRDSTDDNGTKVFFSQLLEQGYTKIGDCFQQNDPTSEELSDLLDTDGGFVSIPEAHNIKKLHTFGPDLYVFAENGVWKIGGVDDVFRATEYSVSKVSEDGIVTPNSFVSAAGRPYWWGNGGIYTLAADPNTGLTGAQNMSVSTIQTFWDRVGATERSRVQGSYDDVTRRVFWAYPSSGEPNENKLNEILVWDEVLGSFFPWKIADQQANTSYMVGLAFSNGTGSTTITYNVVDSLGNQVVNSLGDNVIVQREGQSLSSALLKVLYRDSTGAVSFAEFSNVEFADWGDADYLSFAETAYNWLGSALSKKTAPYVLSIMKTTETGWIANDAGDGYDSIRPSGLLLSTKWDFRKTAGGATQQCYRLKYPVNVDISDLSDWNYPETVVQSRLKVRGRGRSMVLRWESETGKDFHLLGYAILAGSNARI